MKANTKNRKGGSPAKKLIPAAGSLMISAVMLASSTYAWFTMSREVEVTGIKMTASVPANLQVSIGNNMFNTTGESWHALDATVNSTGEGATNRLTGVTVPGAGDDDLDWTNSIVISDYYNFGKLTPATSINGAKLWYTKDATGVGKTLKMSGTSNAAAFTDATLAAGKEMTSVAVCATQGSGTASAMYDNGNGYYIDIPVWFRTSSETDVNLAVIATISPDTSTEGTRSTDAAFDIYKAARVSIIQGEGSVPSIIPDGATAANEQNTAAGSPTQGVLYNSASETVTVNSISKTLQSKYYAQDANYTAGRVASVSTDPKTYDGDDTAGWKDVTKITEATMSGQYISNAAAANTVAVVKGATVSNKNYGVPCRYTIRVWIDGEDVNCWNATAAQDFIIDLKFVDKSNTAPA